MARFYPTTGAALLILALALGALTFVEVGSSVFQSTEALRPPLASSAIILACRRTLVIPTYFGDAYLIFLLRQFFMGIPNELSEAARIDGANEVAIFTRIVLPLARPAITVVALFQFMFAWNDYIGPLIYLNQPETFPISLGLQRFMGQFVEKLAWPYLMAASTVTILPIVILYFVTQRTFIEGIAVTGIKG